MPFGRELYIDRNDFREDPPKNYYRLAPGREARLRYACLIRCEEVVRNEAGEVVELRCTYDPETRGGRAPDGRKVRGAIHWVSATRAIPVEVRLYDRLFRTPDPEAGEDDFMAHINPDSLVTLRDAMIEPSVAGDMDTQRYQFEREGYFWRDPEDSTSERLVFNRIVPLRDTWAKIEDRTRGCRSGTNDRGSGNLGRTEATSFSPPLAHAYRTDCKAFGTGAEPFFLQRRIWSIR